ncbi:MAG: hypothetical protein ABII79_10325 [bacterium]
MFRAMSISICTSSRQTCHIEYRACVASAKAVHRAEGNVDGIDGPAGAIDVADITYRVAYLFTGGLEPPPCP